MGADDAERDVKRGRLGALSERNFRNLYLGRAFSLFGDALVPVALAFAVLDLDRSASALGTVLAVRAAALVLFLLIGGVIADRLPRRSILIVSDVIRLLAHGTMALLILSGNAELWHLVVLSGVFGLGWAFFLPTSTGFIPETVSASRIQQANALIASTYSFAQILGPVVAGVVVVAAGAGWALALDALTFLVSAIFVARINARAGGRERPASSVVVDFKEGWREFTARTWLWVDGVYSAVTALVVLPAFFALGPLVADRFLGGARSWATIVTAFGIGSVLGGLALLRLRPRRPLVVGVPPLVLLGVPLALLATTGEVVLIAAGALAGGFGLTMFNTLFETAVQEHVPAAALSRVASIDWMLSQALQPLGYALVGPITASFGLDVPLKGAALWILITTTVVLTVPSVRQLTRRNGGPNHS
jgi:predicted MFS family arabinose efflux permease